METRSVRVILLWRIRIQRIRGPGFRTLQSYRGQSSLAISSQRDWRIAKILCDGQKERRKDSTEGTHAAEDGSSVTAPGSRRRSRPTDRQTDRRRDRRARHGPSSDDDDATRHAHVLFDERTLAATATTAAAGRSRRCEEETRALPG